MEKMFRWANKKDVEEIKKFLAENFGPDSIQAAPGRFESLFLDHPEGFHVALCFVEGTLAGLRTFWPARIAFEDQILQATFPADTMVAPRYRRMGIGKRFLEMAIDKFQINISNGQSLANAKLYEKMGASIVSNFKKGYLIRRPSFKGPIRAVIRDYMSWAFWIGRKHPRPYCRLLDTEEASRIISTFGMRNFSEEVSTIINKDSFVWRYGGRFYRDYLKCWVEFESSKSIVVSREINGELKVVDVFCKPEDNLQILKAIGSIDKYSKITTVFTGKRLEKEFKKAGFLIRPMDANLVVLASEKFIQKELSQRDWVIYSGDADTDLRYFPQ